MRDYCASRVRQISHIFIGVSLIEVSFIGSGIENRQRSIKHNRLPDITSQHGIIAQTIEFFDQIESVIDKTDMTSQITTVIVPATN